MPSYLKYRDDLEKVDPAEPGLYQKIIDLHLNAQHQGRQKYGVSVRASHAKAHGFLKGKFIVRDGLPVELAQGLFAKPGTYDLIARTAQVPGEMLDDDKVSTPRGMAIKIFGVEGEKLGDHAGETTQDFVFNNGKTFIANGLREFILEVTPNTTLAPKLPQSVKGAVSKTALAANKALGAIGLMSAKLDFFGHPRFHPLSEAYYSQVPHRFGDYVAKFGIIPASPALKALFEKTIDISDANGLRKATVEFFRNNEAVFDFCVQLGVDEETTPIEEAAHEWPENQSPYRPVAQIVLPPQDAFSDAKQDAVDLNLSFSPAHTLAAFRPLGAIMRARLATYPVLANARRSENARPTSEPKSAAEIPE